ncbi:MAG: BatA domain-containing protein, partial [Geminicoccaceae bacterium]|nr:BatA domain-containing protein [Geminicoccaceae bacterium]
MLGLGWLGFAQPWLLAALIALPALWWLLRIIPPAPKRISFPAIRFLFGLEPDEQTSARTPLWLLILRLAIAALIIVALAGPVLNPEPELDGDGPVVLVVDDGWAAAAGWDERIRTLERFAERARRTHREVVLVRTAPQSAGPMVERMSAADAARLVPTLEARPWPVDRAAAGRALSEEGLSDAEVVWLSDGVAVSDEDRRAARHFAGTLADLGELVLYADPPVQRSALLQVPEAGEGGLDVSLVRPVAGPAEGRFVRALGPDGETLARRPIAFAEGATVARTGIDLPSGALNQIARIQLDPPAGVSGVVLLDERWRRRTVGLIGPAAAQEPQPLLADLYYVERALAPHAEVRQGSVAELLEEPLSAIVLPDSAVVSPEDRDALAGWIDQGGVLIRFAGSRLASNELPGEQLVPVTLRRGDRNLDGALTWAEPLPLTSFDDDGPLHDLDVTEGDVIVRRQVLAQPGPDLAEKSWARLADGTPLVTGAPRGDGWLVLIHTTANTAWSSLPLSGVFVDMLRRIVGLGSGTAGTARGLLAPIEVLNADGRLVEPPPTVEPVDAAAFRDTVVSVRHPAGLYAPVGASEEAAGEALNLASAVPALQALEISDFGLAARPFADGSEIDLMPWLLLIALVLALVDTLIGLAMRGLVPGLRAPATAAGVAVLLVAGGDARAQVDEGVVAATTETRLAYVATGLPSVDEVSRAGLQGLSLVLNRRTAVEAGDPRGVNLAVDDLNLFPLLYWPIRAEHPDLAAGVL